MISPKFCQNRLKGLAVESHGITKTPLNRMEGFRRNPPLNTQASTKTDSQANARTR